MKRLQKSNIEWTQMTWNPITGCLHGCDYCYANKIAGRFGYKSREGNENTLVHIQEVPAIYLGEKIDDADIDSFPFGFEPTFHRYRLQEPRYRKKPAKIFTCSMGDLFGLWVPDSWIEDVLDIMRKCPQHTFQLLTKGPDYRLANFDFPPGLSLSD